MPLDICAQHGVCDNCGIEGKTIRIGHDYITWLCGACLLQAVSVATQSGMLPPQPIRIDATTVLAEVMPAHPLHAGEDFGGLVINGKHYVVVYGVPA